MFAATFWYHGSGSFGIGQTVYHIISTVFASHESGSGCKPGGKHESLKALTGLLCCMQVVRSSPGGVKAITYKIDTSCYLA